MWQRVDNDGDGGNRGSGGDGGDDEDDDRAAAATVCLGEVCAQLEVAAATVFGEAAAGQWRLWEWRFGEGGAEAVAAFWQC